MCFERETVNKKDGCPLFFSLFFSPFSCVFFVHMGKLTRDAIATHSQAKTLMAQGLRDLAAEKLARLCKLDPTNADALFDYGVLLTQLGRAADAVHALSRLVTLVPECGRSRAAFADALRRAGEVDASAQQSREAASLRPRDAWVRLVCAVSLQTCARFAEAEQEYRAALEIDSRYAAAATGLGRTLLRMGKVGEALAVADQILRVGSGDADAHHLRGQALLALGDWDRGWADYEMRLDSESFQTIPRLAVPRWRGEVIAGENLLVQADEGIGDAIQLSRYLPRLAEQRVHVILACQRDVRELLATAGGLWHIVREEEPLPHIHRWVSIGSLGALFGATPGNVPREVPYLKADASILDRWRQRLAAISPRPRERVVNVGIVWAGNPLHQNDRARSCSLEQFFPLSQVPGVRLLSLQRGVAAESLSVAPEHIRITSLGGELNGFSETAGLMEALDLLISVDTSVVHAAGALGRPVWNLLEYGPDWRWMRDRTNTPWYPTMRLFRQPKLYDWPSVFEDVRASLESLVHESQQ